MKSIDLFAKPISFSQKKQFDADNDRIVTRDSYQTSAGGFLMILILLATAGYGYFLVTDSWQTEDATGTGRNMGVSGHENHRDLEEEYWVWNFQVGVLENHIQKPLYNDTTEYRPFKEGFMMAINTQYIPYDPTMFKFVWRVNGATPKVIDVRNCTENDFHPDVRFQLQYLPLASMKCPSNVTDLIIVGGINNQTSFSLDIVYCDDNGVNDCTNLSNIGSVVGMPIMLHWIEGMYHYNYPKKPIKYFLRAGRQLLIDATGIDSYQLKLTRHEVLDIDTRTRNFWTVDIEDYAYSFTGSTEKQMANFNFKLADGYYKYNQFYDYRFPYDNSRNLADTVINTKIQTKTEKEEEKIEDGILFTVFYISSQLGGFYSFLVALLGFIMYPMTRQLFLQDTVDDLKMVNDLKIKQLLNPEEEIDIRDIKLQKGRFNFLDMLYNVFCCCKSKNSRLGQRAIEFRNELSGMNEGRDVVNIATSLDMLEYKVKYIEHTLIQKQQNRGTAGILHKSLEEEKEFKDLGCKSSIIVNTQEQNNELSLKKSICKGEYDVEPVPEVSENKEDVEPQDPVPSSQSENSLSDDSRSNKMEEKKQRNQGISDLIEIANLKESEQLVSKE